MKSFEEIEEAVRQARVQAGPALDDRVLADAEHTLAGSWRVRLGRGLLKARPWLKVAAVLVVGVGLLSVLLPTHNGLVPESVAVAEVLKAIDGQDGVFVQGTRICTFGADGNTPLVYNCRTIKRATNAGYIDSTLDEDGTPLLDVCYHYETGTVTVVYHFLRQYYRFQVPPSYRARLREMTVLGLIDFLFRSGNYESLEPRRFQDVRAPGFAVTDVARRFDEGLGPTWARYFFFNVERSRMTLWVDPRTKLPIHMEGDFDMAGCLFTDFEHMRLQECNDRWRWGHRIDPAEFFPEAPKGYQAVDLPGGSS